MNVIWKRPDGFHGASPDDYYVVDIASRSRIWLHRKDRENYPFRVSGGWQDEDATLKLNLLINLLGEDDSIWKSHLKSQFADSKAEDGKTFMAELSNWLDELVAHLKGDTWEVEIMAETLSEVKRRAIDNSKILIT